MAYRRDEHIKFDVPEASWKLALERTRGLAERRIPFDGEIHHLIANAYIQGVVDTGLNLQLIGDELKKRKAASADPVAKQ